LINRTASLKQKAIAEKTGLPLTWVKSFHLKGYHNSSSIDKVESLYNFLTGSNLADGLKTSYREDLI